MLDQIQIVRVEEVCLFGSGGEVGVIIKDNVRTLVLQGYETSLCQIAVSITLLVLLTNLIKAVKVVRHHNQVRLVSTTSGVEPKGIHVALHGHGVGNRRRSRDVGAGHFQKSVFPERPGSGVDAANSAFAVRGNLGSKAANLVGQSAV